MMGDIAFIFHFPPSELKNMTIEELIFWQKEAIEKTKMINFDIIAGKI